jgi:uncharacterized metal-binding protein
MFLSKVGVVSCSGEDCIEGTISRIATRLVLEKLRPFKTVTICLPLFLAGGVGERKFAELFPTITVDGCNKKCAKIAVEKYSGKTAENMIISDLIRKSCADKLGSRRGLNRRGVEVAFQVAEEIAAKIDEIFTGKS